MKGTLNLQRRRSRKRFLVNTDAVEPRAGGLHSPSICPTKFLLSHKLSHICALRRPKHAKSWYWYVV